MKPCAVIAMTLLVAVGIRSVHAESAVYKCTTKAGTVVFSPTPCGQDARQVDTRAAQRSGTAPNVQGVSDMAAASSIDLACASRTRAVNEQAAADVRLADAEIAQLREKQKTLYYQSAGTPDDREIKARMQAAADRKATAQGKQQRDLAAAQHDCDAKRADEKLKEQARDERAREVANHAAQKADAAQH